MSLYRNGQWPILNLLDGLNNVFNDPVSKPQSTVPSDDWMNQWDVKPSSSARYLPDYPAAEDNSLGADIRRTWHDMYKKFAGDKVGEHFPTFMEQAPAVEPQQSYPDYVGGLQNFARSNLGLPPAVAERPAAQETEWFKPYDQMLNEVEQRLANGEIFDENNNWVKAEQNQLSSDISATIFPPNQSSDGGLWMKGMGNNIEEAQATAWPETQLSWDITQPKSTGENVVDNSVNVVDKMFGYGDFLKDIAYVESKYGKDKGTFSIYDKETGKDVPYYGGIWRVDRIGFDDTQNVESHPGLSKAYETIKNETGIDWKKVQYEDLQKPLYSAIAARLKLKLAQPPIPSAEDINARGQYYKQYYNSILGKGSPEKFTSDITARDLEKNRKKRNDTIKP